MTTAAMAVIMGNQIKNIMQCSGLFKIPAPVFALASNGKLHSGLYLCARIECEEKLRDINSPGMETHQGE